MQFRVFCTAHHSTHGRSTPLIWKSYRKSTLNDHQRKCEREMLDHLKKCIPSDVQITVIADRGFAPEAVYESELRTKEI